MKPPRSPKSLLYIIPVIILIGLLCFSVIRALRIYIPQELEQKSFEELKELAKEDDPTPEKNSSKELKNGENNKKTKKQFTSLTNKNPDFACWIKIKDTIIDYPVMKSSEDDPEYYLHRDFYGNSAFSGCLFVGGNCTVNSTSFIIYGHNMNNDTMFGTLDSYSDYSFAKSHSEISIRTPDEDRVYRVFAAFTSKIYKHNEDVFKYYQSIGNLKKNEYQDIVDNVCGMSKIDIQNAPEFPQQLLFLSTCSYHTDDGRFVVAAYREK